MLSLSRIAFFALLLTCTACVASSDPDGGDGSQQRRPDLGGEDPDAGSQPDTSDPDMPTEPDTPDADNPEPGQEDSDAACSDGFDNDGNGYTDCEDFSCSRNASITVCGDRVPEDNDAACSDGVDNDSDGFTDCGDFDCSRSARVTVCEEEPDPIPEDSDAACSDGLDNDQDGDVDCEDAGCARLNVCLGDTTGNERTDLLCRDGIDNDDDGVADCFEPSCAEILSAEECGPDPFDGMTELDGDDLRNALLSAIDDHNVYNYTLARDVMYGIRDSIDIFDGKIEGIYTGAQVEPDRTRTPGGDFQTEHSWPRSDGSEEEPAVSDIHHLFPALAQANQVRSNRAFGWTSCQGNDCSWEGGGSKMGRNEDNELVFQVRAPSRGNIARAHFYFAVRYDMSIPAQEEAVLRAWHASDPPDQRERTRNRRIERHQRNLNPFVLHPEFVDAISDF